MITSKTPVGDLKMIGPSYQIKLKKLGINTVEDLLYHIPFRYEDYSLVSPIGRLQEGETATIFAEIMKFEDIYTKSGKKIQKIVVADGSGRILLIFFNQAYLNGILRPGLRVTVAGTVSKYIMDLAFLQPHYEINKGDSELLHTGRIVPIYPETEGLTSKWLRSRIAVIIHKLKIDFPELLPTEILKKYHLLSLHQAINSIHFPQSLTIAGHSRHRLSFNELIVIQLASLIRKREIETNSTAKNMKDHQNKIEKFIQNLPFTLTSAQNKAVGEILTDMTGSKPMNRLLLGDVGSGKTIVALIAFYFTFLNGFKSLFMAPTEILASQHYQTLLKFLKSLGMNISLITGNLKPNNSEISKTDVYIGTHALLNLKLPKEKIALIVIDEQQRFGVEQRALLRLKGSNPHLLSLTATPIPRTVALTLYADLDLSVIDEMPPGRLKVKTFVVAPEKRQAAYVWINKQLTSPSSKQQAFIICPLIEESESLLSVKSAKKEFYRLQKEVFPYLKLGLIHGRLKSSEKNRIIDLFKEGQLDILVATPVVEVGLDIPRATIIMIEASERFGLSQLHQLRGRVGRRNQQSYCLLFSQTDNQNSLDRLKFMEKYHIGIQLAEYDLKIRGPGQFFGYQQHGSLGLKFTDFSDLSLIKNSQQAALDILRVDPFLEKLPLLREKVIPYTIQNIAPD